MELSRRALLRRSALVAGGALLGAGAVDLDHRVEAGTLPLGGGYAPAADHLDLVAAGRVLTHWSVPTNEPVVALTFDDGPGPHWTPMVLDTLDAHAAPATFFLVGSHLAAHAELVRGRLGRHAVGNHTWSHADLATMDLAGAQRQLWRTHELIERVTGVTPQLMRPPYGHMGGSTLLAAGSFGYDVVLWSQQMHERAYRRDPAGQVRDIVDNARPGAIILAHDVGAARRLVALRQLGPMIDGLRAQGLQLVTVPQLLALRRPDPAPPGASARQAPPAAAAPPVHPAGG